MRKRLLLKFALPVILVVLLTSSVALAQTFALSKGTVSGGGEIVSTGDTYSLGGSIGLPVVGVASGGDFTLGSGFWGGGTLGSSGSYSVYLPITLKNSP